MREQTDKDFQKCLEIGHKGEAVVSQILTEAGYNVWDVGSHRYEYKYRTKGEHKHKYRYLHVDQYVTGEHRFWVEVKVRYGKFWIDTNDIEWLVEWHIRTHIPPFVIFVNREEECYIISLYGARNKNRASFIRFEDTMPLSKWLAKIQEFPDKWRGVI